MAKTRAQKAQQLEALNQALGRNGVVFFSYTGLKVSELEALRTELRKDNSTMVVAKRNLLRLAMAKQGIAYDDTVLSGAVALAVGDDEVMPAKTLAAFKKKYELVKFQGGLLEHRFMTAVAVEQLSALPGKPDLLAQLIGSLQAASNGLVNVLAGNLRGLVNVLTAIKANKAELVN